MIRCLSALAATATAATTLVAGAALAGGTVPAPAPAPYIAPLPAEESWGGFYAGLSFAGTDGVVESVVDFDIEGEIYGGFFGYRVDFGSYVLGGEISVMHGEIEDNITNSSIDTIARSGFEFGYDLGSALIYGTAGVNGFYGSNTGLGDDDDMGYFYGIGLDYRVVDNILVSVDLIRHEVTDFENTGVDIGLTSLGLGVAYEF
ncbi:hypothetical protein roselon_03070 [Roseibacterium elongatum DSM 19469]|uniref:Outer membrane protein beta-barrel domain-containing protein n=1 Tax=Roseicyclus elongatus DSM 19469 TaxID=1294273 RepID=W8RVM9_9RHOB|nr:outer membrane beta-barrel protein [Roseibacterium elongatum]AHM05343.1 hypothetical protein roselon_03070 [Roseibacterium elongatum DSM 19469]